MKKYIILLIIGLLFHTSCKDTFFEKYPTDSMTVENYMNNTKEIQTVLYAAYAAMRGTFANSIVYIGDLPTDNAYDYKLNNSTANIALHESTVDSQNTIISGLWYACYQIINRCNLVISNMDKVVSTPVEYNQLVGEAKFLRAYTYYVMVRVWGDVPLVLKDITDYMDVFNYARTPVDEVYAQIILDLKDAESKLPDIYTAQTDKGKATATAAQAILGDVYLTRGDYTNAKIYFEKVIAKEGANLGLLTDYASIFIQSNANNKEIIFAVQYANNQTPALGNYLGSAALGNIQGIPIAPGGIASQIYGVNILMMTHELEAKFAVNDKRRSVVYTNLISPDYGCTIPMTLKYFDYQNVTDKKSGNPDSGCETIISRYSDIILKYAECLNAANDYTGAIAQIKRVRDRAGLTTSITADKASVSLAIENERQLELCMEGHRWFDLLRTGRTLTVMSDFYNRKNVVVLPPFISVYEYGNPASPLTISDFELLFPIPYAQVVLNPNVLIQNFGY